MPTNTDKTNTDTRTEWRLEDKAGQPWTATSYAEAFSLMCQGYTLLDGNLNVNVPTGEPGSPAVDTAVAEQAGSTAADTSAPPKSGAGSGRDAWASYAGSHGVAVDDGTTRDEIIAALVAAGVPTE